MEALIYLLLYIAEAYIMYQYCVDLFVMKYTRAKSILYIVLGHLFMYLLSFFHNVYLNISAYAIILFLLLSVLFSLRAPHALFHTLILSLTMALSEALVTSIMSVILSDAWVRWASNPNLIILGSLSKLVYFLISRFLVFMQKKNVPRRYTTDFGTVILIIINFCTITTSILLCILGWNLPHSSILEYTIATGSVLLFVILLLVYHLYNYNQKKNADFTDLQLRLQKESDTVEYYRMLTAQDEKQKIIIHDIRNHLYTLAQLSQSSRQNEVSEYLNRLIHSDSLAPSIRVCSNELLNAILCRYQLQCQEKGIDFHTDIRSGCADFLRDEEMTALFCNLLDNAMEATADMHTHAFIEISMRRREHPSLTTLVVENSSPAPPGPDSHGRFVTTKSDFLHHGYGLRSIERIAKTYHGHMRAYYNADDSTFHTIISFYP